MYIKRRGDDSQPMRVFARVIRYVISWAHSAITSYVSIARVQSVEKIWAKNTEWVGCEKLSNESTSGCSFEEQFFKYNNLELDWSWTVIKKLSLSKIYAYDNVNNR